MLLTFFFFFSLQPVSRSVPLGLQQFLLEAEQVIVEVTLNLNFLSLLV